MSIELPDGRLYVAGGWREGRGEEIVSLFPADRTVNRVIRGASRDDVAEAIDAAARAQVAWGRLKAHERASVLHRISDGIAASVERIAHIQSRDTGKTLRETRALATSAAGTFRYFAAVAETVEDAVTPARADTLTLSVHEPLGVVGAITPWNSPIASDAQKIAPALAAGNAVVLKPSSWSPLVSLELARIVDAAGLPPGLFSTLPGAGGTVGDAIVADPRIAKVSFTGGTATGRAIARAAADKLMPVSLELGGKSPTIVFADADMDLALSAVLFGIFSSTGQSCIAGARLFVERSVYPAFLRRLTRATDALIVGHPFEAATQVAPLVRDRHRDQVEAFVAGALAEGGRIVAGGRRPAGLDGGVYYRPTLIEGLDNTARTAREEIFGPVLLAIPFDDEAGLIAQADDSPYGLALGLFTRDTPKALRIAREIRAGTVWINTYKQFSIATPFGGFKDSGLGREKGLAGYRAWQAQKGIYLDLTGAPHPWAAETVRAIP